MTRWPARVFYWDSLTLHRPLCEMVSQDARVSISYGSLDLYDHMAYYDPANQLSFPGMRYPENVRMSGISHIMAPQRLDTFLKLFLYSI